MKAPIVWLVNFLIGMFGLAMESPEARVALALSPVELENLVTLINDSYSEGEKNICQPLMQRISTEALHNIIAKGELIVLRIHNTAQGCIQVSPSPYDAETAIFGMLAVANNPQYRGKGFGTMLVDEAEKWAKSKGYKFMNLELLKPLDFAHSHKDRLQVWYEKRGYIYQYSKPFMLEDLLIIKNYDFKIFRKEL